MRNLRLRALPLRQAESGDLLAGSPWPEAKLPRGAPGRGAPKAFFGNHGDVIADIYRERVVAGGCGSGHDLSFDLHLRK